MGFNLQNLSQILIILHIKARFSLGTVASYVKLTTKYFTFHIKNIEEIAYAKIESQSEKYADDTSIFMKRNPKYLRECVSILKYFARISGLQRNPKKSLSYSHRR